MSVCCSVIILPACQQYNGLENAAQLHYRHAVDVFTGAVCEEGNDSYHIHRLVHVCIMFSESLTISRLALRWSKLYLSYSRILTVQREKTTISMQPAGPKGVTSAMIALCRDMRWNDVSLCMFITAINS